MGGLRIHPNAKSTELISLALRLQRGELLAAECPSRSVLKHVTSQWGVLVLMVLVKGTKRFSEIRRSVKGVSEKMLAQTLQSLETDGFVKRKSFPVVPPHVEYTLTPLGEEVSVHVTALADWIESNLAKVIEARNNSAHNDV